jgi:glycosyltransferase involved in cell wall biosynthesis
MNMTLLTTSVIVPVYNGEATLGACIESLLEQSYPSNNYEIVIVENCSSDRTTAVAGRYPVKLLHNSAPGPSAARQLGFLNSQADIVAFTDADCYADVNWLSELLMPYSDSQVGGVGGAVLAYKHTGRNLIEQWGEDNQPFANFGSGIGEFLPHLHTCNASYRRELLQRVGGFDTRLVTADDTDVSWRLQLKTGCTLAYAPGAIIYHHHRATRRGLAKQYRQYGFAEILLDTMYRDQPCYPRTRGWQVKRMLGQLSVLPRYLASTVLRGIRMVRGKATPYQAAWPGLWLLVEGSNIRGKFEGLWATRFMTDEKAALGADSGRLVDRYFQNKKE